MDRHMDRHMDRDTVIGRLYRIGGKRLAPLAFAVLVFGIVGLGRLPVESDAAVLSAGSSNLPAVQQPGSVVDPNIRSIVDPNI